MRVNVYLPDELAATIRASVPELNLSRALQDALRGLLSCRHDQLECSACAAKVDRGSFIDRALSAFYWDLVDELHRLVDQGGTAEGAGRIAKDVAQRHQVSAARNAPLPRPPASRRGARRRELARPQQRTFTEVDPDYQPPGYRRTA